MKDELVEVTQADRDAAADFADAEARLWSMSNGSAHSGPMRRGERDDTLTVQAFARHRLSSSPVEEAPADVASVVASICQDVAELPDRTSPDDWPDAMLVTAEELGIIIERHFTRLSADLAEARKGALPDQEALLKAERERCAKVATSFLVGDPANGVPLRSPTPHEIAQAIRSLPPVTDELSQ